jgi:hypothetical protein
MNTKKLLVALKKGIRITERGWGGHFCMANKCNFRRNTLISYKGNSIIVSTVGGLFVCVHDGSYKYELQSLGADNRFYETMAFHSKKEGVYIEADISRQINFASPYSIHECNLNSDKKANKMHDDVVEEFVDMFIRVDING